MYRTLCTTAASIAVSLILALPMSAQGYAAGFAGPSMASARVGVAPVSASSLPMAAAALHGLKSTDTRSSGLAIGMSAIVPGTGSMYAGNARHGIIHFAVATASLITIAGALSQCVPPSFSFEPDCESHDGVVNVAAAGFVANYVWSIISAAHDAKAYHRRDPASP